MDLQLSLEEAQKVLKGVTIPPRPTLLVSLNQELQKDDPDLRRVAALIAKDVAISAAMLKTVNSPLFGLRNKLGNIPQAVQVLGLRNVRNLVTGLVLRKAMGGPGLSLERFWDSSEKVASISVYLCSLLPRSPREDAYTFGIFHDCGIPILMQRFPDYKETLRLAAGLDVPQTQVEDERHGTNHVVLGYMVAKSWGLPPTICDAILRHHDVTVFREEDSTEPTARMLVAINFLAEHLNDTMVRMRGDEQWERVGGQTLEYLGLNHAEYLELKEDVLNVAA
ncbi:MAG: hypothetical protein RIR00_1318 [Pseudomonadota bacterium]|jgi:HD-like signal output (HDOD) protein